MRVAAPLLFVLFLLSGCASVGALQPAQVSGRGKGQVGLEMSQQATWNRGAFVSYPMVGVSGRYGVSDRVDLGGRVGPTGLEAQVKVQLSAPTSPGVIFSLAPSVGFAATEANEVKLRYLNIALPLLIGVPLPRGHQLLLSPRVFNTLYNLEGGSISGTLNTVSLGASVGVAFRVWKLWLIPEFGVAHPMLVTTVNSSGTGGTFAIGAATTFQLNFSVLWGNS
jgi:hypothetical protein